MLVLGRLIIKILGGYYECRKEHAVAGTVHPYGLKRGDCQLVLTATMHPAFN